MLLDLSSPDAWALPAPDRNIQVGDYLEAATNADMPMPDVDYPREQAQHLSQAHGQAKPAPNDAATDPIASMHTMSIDNVMDDNSIGMEDVDQFMESILKADQMKHFMGTDTLDTPLFQDDTEEMTESRGSQEDRDWFANSHSTCIANINDRKVSASSRVAAPCISFQATSSSRTAAVATSTGITFSHANNDPLQSQEQRASRPGHLNPHDLAMTATVSATSASEVLCSSPSAAMAPQRPVLCKPLTAYNYFYRVERDNIVNGMACATDPLPPVNLDISLEKQEKLLQQHWYVESTMYSVFVRARTTCSQLTSCMVFVCGGGRNEDPKREKRPHRKAHGVIDFLEYVVTTQPQKGTVFHNGPDSVSFLQSHFCNHGAHLFAVCPR
jgi:hypothetical protein